jgi:hypothetical protein
MSGQTELEQSLASAFSGKLITDENDKAPFLIDWRKRYQGNALGIAIPDTVEDVAKVVQWCRDNQHRVVPQGGNTGMSGAATPDSHANNVVLSLTRLKRIRETDRKKPDDCFHSVCPPKAAARLAAICRPMPGAVRCCASAMPANFVWGLRLLLPTASYGMVCAVCEKTIPATTCAICLLAPKARLALLLQQP